MNHQSSRRNYMKLTTLAFVSVILLLALAAGCSSTSRTSPDSPLNSALAGGEPANCEGAQVIKITAKKFEFSPSEITLKLGVPVILELTSEDVQHGFSCPGLNLHAEIDPGRVTRLCVVPKTLGRYDFHCDIFCGLGHGDMRGTIIVTN
jgi:cytochrome c oxidase subunit 2